MGALLLILVLLYLPFLQMRMAMLNRLSAAFNVCAVRADYKRAPWAFALSFVVTLLLALPLYLLKIEIVPREAAWLPSLVFIAFIFPARLLTGWALSRARTARNAAPLVLPLDRPTALPAGGDVLRDRGVLHAVH